jgi:hypothetical protein
MGVDFIEEWDKVTEEQLFRDVVRAVADENIRKSIEADEEGKYRKVFGDVFAVRTSKTSSKKSQPVDGATMQRLSLFMGCDASGLPQSDAGTSPAEVLIMMRSGASAGPEWAAALATSDACTKEWDSAAAAELGRIVSSRLLLNPEWIAQQPMQTACLIAYGMLARKGDGYFDSVLTLILAQESVAASRFVAACVGFLGFWAKRVPDSNSSSAAACCQPLYVHHYLSAVVRQGHEAKLEAGHVLSLMLLYCWASGQQVLRAFASASKLPRDVLSFLDKYLASAGKSNVWVAVQGLLRRQVSVLGKDGAEATEAMEEAGRRANTGTKAFLSWFASNAELVSLADAAMVVEVATGGTAETDEEDEDDDDDNDDVEESDKSGSNDDDGDGDEEGSKGVLGNYVPDDEGAASALEKALSKLK